MTLEDQLSSQAKRAQIWAKLNLLQIKIELDGEKQRQNTLPLVFPQIQLHPYIPNSSTSSTLTSSTRGGKWKAAVSP